MMLERARNRAGLVVALGVYLSACAAASTSQDPPDTGASGKSGEGNQAGSSSGQAGSSSGSGGEGGASGNGAAGTENAAGAAGAQAGASQAGEGGADPFGGGGAAGSANSGGAGGATSDGCADETKQIYLLGKGNEFYRFDPMNLALEKVGTLSCPSPDPSATPFSMSVDRQATAWVLYNDGNLYKVNILDASCQATAFVPNQNGFKKFGMGFVSDGPGSTSESLYIVNEFGIGKLDTTSLTVTPVGQFGFSAAAELTGTGDGKLYGFFFGFPPYITEINKSTGTTGTELGLDTIDAGTGFAFAFWGADFWVFTAPNSKSSQIDRYQPDTNTTSNEKSDIGFKVVGAGVSTCAPTERPNIQ